jgi:hypothetical protein
MRGLLACNMLQHCLQKRHNVDFGINRWALHRRNMGPTLPLAVCSATCAVYTANICVQAELPDRQQAESISAQPARRPVLYK